MEILYYIINFLILAGIIVLFGRKTIVSIFRNRRTKINSELDRAEGPLPEAESIVLPDTVPADNGKTVEEAKRLADEKTAKLRTYTELECRELSLEKAEKTRKAVLALFAKKVENRYGQGDYAEFEKKNNERMMKEILGMIRLTPGDMSYLKHHDVLYVTLTSAHPLDKELVELAGSAVSELLSKVNGRMSFWVREDPSLIEGLTLRIGDTVYDATAREYVYRVSKAVEKNPVLESDTLDDLISNIETQVENVKKGISVYQLGRVISVSDGICWMDGLADIMYGEVIEFECGERGMVLDIQKDKIGCVIFGRFEHIESYSKVRRVGRIASVPVGDAMLGRVVDAIGKPIDGKGTLRYKEKRPIEFNAPGILDRSAVSRPLHTGIKAIDALVPIGKGQRELLVGDRQTGKTAIVLDAVLSQKGNNEIGRAHV